MKYKIIIVFVLLTTSLFAQIQKKEIIKNYNKKYIEQIRFDLKKDYLKRKKSINKYISNHPNVKKNIIKNGEIVSSIYNIINNRPIYISINNINSAKATRTNFLQIGGSLNLNLTGENMYAGVWDGSPTRATHIEFEDGNGASRVTNPDASASNVEGAHATHVSGTIIAKGNNANAKGMATNANVISYDWDNDKNEVLNEATNNALLLSNHSYGVPVIDIYGNQAPAWMMGCYNTDAREWDQILFAAPYYLKIDAAGNSGNDGYTGGLLNNYDKLTTSKNSKNNLVVANANNPLINPDGSGELLSLFINTSSSQGPTDDGRIKPDITADGTSVFSCIDASDSAYDTYTGTSMAAPNVTGTLILLQEYYYQLNTVYMKSATLKGIVCHTADDDNSSPGPDPIFGWGLLNAKKSAELILSNTNDETLIKESDLANNNTFSYSFYNNGTSKITATLCWTDPAGTAHDSSLNNSTPALVNDLDLRISNDSDTYYPWKLQLSNVAGQAIKGDNLVDNVEKIEIENAPIGNYTLTITHKGTLTNNHQNYSLILNGENIVLSVSNESITTFKAYPNPVKEILTIEGIDKISNVTIFNMLGQKVLNVTPNRDTVNINMNSLNNGTYFAKVTINGATKTMKIIK